MKKLISLLTGVVMIGSTTIADIKIPKGFEGYNKTKNILSVKSSPFKEPPTQVIEYDINGDRKPDVRELYPLKHNGTCWVPSEKPTVYFFDLNGNNIFEEEERVLDLKAYLKWKGYSSEEES